MIVRAQTQVGVKGYIDDTAARTSVGVWMARNEVRSGTIEAGIIGKRMDWVVYNRQKIISKYSKGGRMY